MNLTALEAAYLAGMFDHAGGVYITRSKPTRLGESPIYRLSLEFRLKERETIDEFRRKFGDAGAVVAREGKSWRWAISPPKAYEILDEIDRYVRVRADEVEIARFFRASFEAKHKARLSSKILEERERGYQMMRTGA